DLPSFHSHYNPAYYQYAHGSTHPLPLLSLSFFFFNATPTPEIYTLSLHDALPILPTASRTPGSSASMWAAPCSRAGRSPPRSARSEEHTSELQSRENLVCRLLLEKKKNEVTE